LAAAVQPLEEESVHRMFKPSERAAVVGHAKVVEVAAHLARYCLPEVGEGLHIALLPEPAIDLHQGASQSLLRGCALQPYLACPGPSPVVGKAQKIKGRRALSVPKGLASVIFPTSQQTGLLGVETQPEFPQP
jgi:hypothetical protein